MRYLHLALLVLLLSSQTKVSSQSLSIGFGPVFTHTNQRVKMVDSREDFMNTSAQWVLSYEHFMKGSSVSFLVEVSKYEGATWMRFNEGSYIGQDGLPTLGRGFSGVIVSRLDFMVSYNLLPSFRKYYIKPFAGFGLQRSRDLNYEFGNFEWISGPDYFQLTPIVAKAYNTLQIVPALGFKTGVAIRHRIDVGLTVRGVYGFKSYQDLFFEYSYKGIPQEMAVFESKGTGVFVALSLGYRFKKVE